MTITIYKKQAIDKLNEASSKKLNNVASIMFEPVKNALMLFCEQSEEFAQAIVQGENFEECIKSVASGVGSSISDIEAYCKAVNFYFKTATINVSMTINTEGNITADTDKADSHSSALSLSLDDLLDM